MSSNGGYFVILHNLACDIAYLYVVWLGMNAYIVKQVPHPIGVTKAIFIVYAILRKLYCEYNI
jgi:hypothetical protein